MDWAWNKYGMIPHLSIKPDAAYTFATIASGGADTYITVRTNASWITSIAIY